MLDIARLEEKFCDVRNFVMVVDKLHLQYALGSLPGPADAESSFHVLRIQHFSNRKGVMQELSRCFV